VTKDQWIVLGRRGYYLSFETL